MSLASLDGKTRLNGLAVGIVWAVPNGDITGKLHNRDPKRYRQSPRPSLRVFTPERTKRCEGSGLACETMKERAVFVEIPSGYAVPHNETEEEVRGVKDITSLDESLLREIFLT